MYIDRIQEVANIMRPILKESEVANMLSDLELSIKMLNEPAKVKLPIIGVFNAGKTTLVNSLLGADGFPKLRFLVKFIPLRRHRMQKFIVVTSAYTMAI